MKQIKIIYVQNS